MSQYPKFTGVEGTEGFVGRVHGNAPLGRVALVSLKLGDEASTAGTPPHIFKSCVEHFYSNAHGHLFLWHERLFNITPYKASSTGCDVREVVKWMEQSKPKTFPDGFDFSRGR
jgi:hypothetical protein